MVSVPTETSSAGLIPQLGECTAPPDRCAPRAPAVPVCPLPHSALRSAPGVAHGNGDPQEDPTVPSPLPSGAQSGQDTSPRRPHPALPVLTLRLGWWRPRSAGTKRMEYEPLGSS